MFGVSNDNDQNLDPPAAGMPGAPAVDTNAAAGANSPQPNASMFASSAPTLSGPQTQINPARPSELGASPTAGPMANSTSPAPGTSNQDLIQIKQQALQSLEPLVGRLNQTPDEKFKTLMMLIQASDNSEMLKEAYDTANQITDEEVRAQALLDIVNEINYFTHQDQTKQ